MHRFPLFHQTGEEKTVNRITIQMFLFQKLDKKIDSSLNMADTGDNPSSDEELSKKERERRFKNHLQCKRTSNGSEETSVDKKNPKKRKINKLWTEEETIELIEQLESRPCLWDVYHATYSKRDVKELAYAELSDQFELPIAEIKSKVNSLRTQFNRELAKESKTKSGQSTDELYKSNWIHFGRLNFLRSVLASSKSFDSINANQNEIGDKVIEENESRLIGYAKGRHCLKENWIYFQNALTLLHLAVLTTKLWNKQYPTSQVTSMKNFKNLTIEQELLRKKGLVMLFLILNFVVSRQAVPVQQIKVQPALQHR